jgi:hypothetical protein
MNAILVDPVNRDVDRVEIVVRIDKRRIGIRYLTIVESDKSDLAYATEVGVRRLKIQG